jgi:DNA-binding transcriptional LysR family regulator
VNLNWLRTFFHVVREGSYSGAARVLGISQPAVSLQMRGLERLYGVRLLSRSGQAVALTDAGRVVFDYASRVAVLERELDTRLHDLQGLRGGLLRLAASLTVGTIYLPPVLKRFLSAFPGPRIRLILGNSAEVLDRVAGLQDDLGLVGRSVDDERLTVEPFVVDEIVLVVPRAHPWSRRRTVSAHALRGQRLIMREAGSMTRQTVEQFLARLGVEVNPAFEVSSNEVTLDLVSANAGVAFLSSTLLKQRRLGRGVRGIRLREGRIVRTFYSVAHRDRPPSPLIEAFLTTARSVWRARRP